MPYVNVNGTKLFYQDQGEGAETIVFSHGFLFSTKMFSKQIEVLKDSYRVIAYDHRGQGQSEIPDSGYGIDNCTEDGYELIKALDLKTPVHFVGLSMGGFVGQRLAIRHPEVIKSLILINTSAENASGIKLLKFRILRIFGRIFGLGLVVGQVMKSLFGKEFLQDPNRVDERNKWKEFIANNDKVGVYRAFEAAVFRDNIVDQLHKINVPVLILGGKLDKGLSPEESETLNEHIPNSKLVIFEKSGHSSTIEVGDQVNTEINAFLSTI